MEIEVRVTNTLSGKKERVEPLNNNTITLYVCGITPYDYAHIGHGRVYVTFDVLYRLLMVLGYKVNYCRNFTDIDDKILKRAQQELGQADRYKEIAERFITAFHEDMRQLNCLPPLYEPRVTDFIQEIVAFVAGLIDRGYAYVRDGDVYFSIEKRPDYGKLSKRDIKDLLAGARVDIREEKKNPLDFALWKSAGPDDVGWQSPWGKGRPGWHIECSVMAYHYLGEELDIHAGGMDLIFPHHENEIAQSESLFDKPLARYWMHNAFVRLDEEKMSKSLGNIINLRDIFSRFSPALVRYYILMHHYRAPLDFSFEDLEVAEKSYKRLINLFEREKNGKESIGYQGQKIARRMLEFLCDDLNTPGMFGIVFEHIKTLQEDQWERAGAYYILYTVCGLLLEPLAEKKVVITPEIKALIQEREKARQNKNWARADELRDQLQALGVELQDKKIS